MYLGKSVRLERIFNRNTGKTIIVPLDHGVSVGPIFGIVDLRVTVDKVADGATARRIVTEINGRIAAEVRW